MPRITDPSLIKSPDSRSAPEPDLPTAVIEQINASATFLANRDSVRHSSSAFRSA